MNLEETIQSLTDSASAQEARLAQLEENNRVIGRVLDRLAVSQKVLEFALEETWRYLEREAAALSLRRNSRRPLSKLRSNGYRKDHSIPHRDCRPARRPPR